MVLIDGYKHVQHRIIKRPWGMECQFTVQKESEIVDDVVILKEISEIAIETHIREYLEQLEIRKKEQFVDMEELWR